MFDKEKTPNINDMKNLINPLYLKTKGDEKGSLISLEENKNIPFTIKRTYYIFRTQEGISRGYHAHKKLSQVALCIAGSCRFILDNGHLKEEIILNSPDKGIFIDPLIWHEMHDFSHDCILLVLADDYYDENDYIRNYDTFKNYISDNS